MWKVCTILIYIFATFLALLCFCFAISVAYISAVVFLPTYFPTKIHKFSRTWDIESSLDLNDPSVKLSPWGLPYDSECGAIRMIFLDMDCMEPAGKCQERIEEFEKEFGKGKNKKEREVDFSYISKYCFEAANCMRDIACKEATYQFNKFHKFPHTFFLNYSTFPSCMTKFYEAVRDDSFDNCTLNYQFLSKEPLYKNHAYFHGKYCFLSFTREFCEYEISEYLKNYYEFFMEFAMIPSLDGCGIFEKFEALECQESMKIFENSVEMLKIGNQTQSDYRNVALICDKMQNCFENLTNPCGIPEPFRVKTKEYCEKMHFYSSPFWQCLERLKSENYQPDLLQYPCFIGHQFNDDSRACSRFKESEECIRNIMIDHCGSELTDGFENSKNYLLEMWDC